MAQHAHLDPSAFFLAGGATGILLIHGFTGSPPEMRWLGEYLHGRGMTVSAPLLPGHGTTIEDMNRHRWTDWTAHVENALADLQARCRLVFVSGLSLGSLLALHLASQHGELPGIALYSPPLWIRNRLLALTPIARYFVQTQPVTGASDLFDPEADGQIWGYTDYPVPAAAELLHLMRRVRRELPRITCPALVLYSTRDGSIRADSAQRTYERLGSRDKQIVPLSECGHCMTVDREREDVAARTWEFVRSHGG